MAYGKSDGALSGTRRGKPHQKRSECWDPFLAEARPEVPKRQEGVLLPTMSFWRLRAEGTLIFLENSLGPRRFKV